MIFQDNCIISIIRVLTHTHIQKHFKYSTINYYYFYSTVYLYDSASDDDSCLITVKTCKKRIAHRSIEKYFNKFRTRSTCKYTIRTHSQTQQ